MVSAPKTELRWLRAHCRHLWCCMCMPICCLKNWKGQCVESCGWAEPQGWKLVFSLFYSGFISETRRGFLEELSVYIRKFLTSPLQKGPLQCKNETASTKVECLPCVYSTLSGGEKQRTCEQTLLLIMQNSLRNLGNGKVTFSKVSEWQRHKNLIFCNDSGSMFQTLTRL